MVVHFYLTRPLISEIEFEERSSFISVEIRSRRACLKRLATRSLFKADEKFLVAAEESPSIKSVFGKEPK